MSYETHIHRADDHFDAAENPIPREEWDAWVANAPDFHFSEADHVTFQYEDGERNERLASWTEHPDGADFALYYYDGAIVAGNPDEHMIRRMVRIADDLGARLQGDDGEFYGSEGEPLTE
jgi:hypothetical protein